MLHLCFQNKSYSYSTLNVLNQCVVFLYYVDDTCTKIITSIYIEETLAPIQVCSVLAPIQVCNVD